MSRLERHHSKIVLRKAEIKRVSEKVNKKELCSAYGINYNYYMNCLSGRSNPSDRVDDSLNIYLEEDTNVVYRRIFEKRELDTKFHEELAVTHLDVINMINILKESGNHNLSDSEVNQLLNTVSENDIARTQLDIIAEEEISEWERTRGSLYDQMESEITMEIDSMQKKIESGIEDTLRQELIAKKTELEIKRRVIKRQKDFSKETSISSAIDRLESKPE